MLELGSTTKIPPQGEHGGCLSERLDGRVSVSMNVVAHVKRSIEVIC